MGPSVLLTHWFGVGFGWLALSERAAVEALVAVGPAGRRSSTTRPWDGSGYGLTPVPLAFGSPRTRRSSTACRSRSCRRRAPGFEPSCRATAEYLRSCGAAVDEIRLGELGIHGNGHAMMLEKNNAEVAAVITDWIVKHT